MDRDVHSCRAVGRQSHLVLMRCNGPLNAVQQQALKHELEQAQERGERWSGRRVAQWMSEQLGRQVHMQRGYEWLAKLGFSPQVPRPAHKNANAEDPAVSKKSSRKP